MRVKFTIAVCALLMLGLAVTQVNAQGFNVSKSETTVVEHGRNQVMGAIRLDYVDSGGNIDDGRNHQGELRQSEDHLHRCDLAVQRRLPYWCCYIGRAAEVSTRCGACAPALRPRLKLLPTTRTPASERSPSPWRTAARSAGAFVILRGVRADTSALSAGDTIVASINSSAAASGFVPIGQDRTESVGGVVSTVKAGLTVKLEQPAGSCAT